MIVIDRQTDRHDQRLSAWFRIYVVQPHHMTSQPEVPYKLMAKCKNINFFHSYILMCIVIGFYGTSSHNITWRGCTTSILNQPLESQASRTLPAPMVLGWVCCPPQQLRLPSPHPRTRQIKRQIIVLKLTVGNYSKFVQFLQSLHSLDDGNLSCLLLVPHPGLLRPGSGH